MNILEKYRECRLCPRECRVDRIAGQRGACGETAECRVASACAHFGEEPVFSGSRGSGTVFFSGCSCGCFFCQNYQISRQHLGETVSSDQLAGMFNTLASQQVHNINLVTPDHFWPHVSIAIERSRADGMHLPVIFNCSGYEAEEMITEAGELVDIFMPDFKYADPALAAACMRAPEYPEVALRAVARMVELRGFLEPFDVSGARTAERGVLVRHLVLPGQVDNSIAVLKLLRQHFGRMLPLSVMSQYRPTPECQRRGFLDRPVTAAEYRQVCEAAEELGFQQVFLQPHFDDTGYSPDFRDPSNPFPGNPSSRNMDGGRPEHFTDS